MKLSDRCRKEARDFYLYDNKDCVEWKAADLLDECEKALSGVLSELTPYHFKEPFNHAHAVATLAKLRAAQEKANGG